MEWTKWKNLGGNGEGQVFFKRMCPHGWCCDLGDVVISPGDWQVSIPAFSKINLPAGLLKAIQAKMDDLKAKRPHPLEALPRQFSIRA